MKYEAVVKKWNDFCVDSGIREYCQKTCEGRCCRSVYKRPGGACGEKCGESITCTIYLCGRLQRKLPKNIDKQYQEYSTAVGKKIAKHRKRGESYWGFSFNKTIKWPNPDELIKELMTVNFI